MKIGVIGPSPVPFTIGGMEKLLWGLCDAINQKTSHQCELIKLPSRENNFWNLIEDYYFFYQLDVSHFDAVICTKYPSWMVRHHNCVFYLPHTLRGLYDTYHFTGLPTEVPKGDPYVDRVMNYIEENPYPESLDELFSILFEMRTHSLISEPFLDFPGPFIRRILIYFDHFGLAQTPWRDIYCISKTVKARTDYFPEGANVQVVYPPAPLKNCSHGGYRHIFMASRLDRPKRIDLLIKAMKYVKENVKLLIAGTGPIEEELKELAKGDDRITFLGFVNDEEMEEYYANSLVIPYFPYDEDYGLITIEAMLHKKPVITTVDAGGPTEFVINNETGFVTKLAPEDIAEKIDYFASHPEEAKRMGENAYEKVKDITWDSVIDRLLETLEPRRTSGRKKITVTSTFPIYPPRGGGQVRIFNLYKNIAKEYDVEVVSFAPYGQQKFQAMIAPGLWEIRIPQSEEHWRKGNSLEIEAKLSLIDIGMITLSHLTPEYEKALKKSIETSDLVVASHPYLYRVIQKYLGDKPLVYEAHNVESELKKAMLSETAIAGELLQQVFDIEKDCCEQSRFIMTCSLEDQKTLNRIYGTESSKVIVVPNGVDTSDTVFTSCKERMKNKKELKLENEKIGIFMGSWHQPNLEAAVKIIELARKCPGTQFMLMGSQCSYFANRKIPQNVGLLGVVADRTKKKVFAAVDFALNPMMSGSGTNLKMFDYMSAGIPVITTELGRRGIDRRDVYIIREVDEMASAVNEFHSGQWEEMTVRARSYIEDVFDWKSIADNVLKRLKAEW